MTGSVSVALIDVAVNFLNGALNDHLVSRLGVTAARATVTRLVDQQGRTVLNDDTLGTTIINIEEERVLRGQSRESSLVAGRLVTTEPPLRLNLHLMFVANFRLLDQGLKYLSLVVGCFQAQPIFRPSTHPALDATILQLSPELQSLTYEQQNQIWAFLGGKYMPSVVYRVRMVVVQHCDIEIVGPPVRQIDIDIDGKSQ